MSTRTKAQPPSKKADEPAQLIDVIEPDAAITTTVKVGLRLVAGVALTTDIHAKDGTARIRLDAPATSLAITLIAGDGAACSWSFDSNQGKISAADGQLVSVVLPANRLKGTPVTVYASRGTAHSCLLAETADIEHTGDSRPPSPAAGPSPSGQSVATDAPCLRTSVLTACTGGAVSIAEFDNTPKP